MSRLVNGLPVRKSTNGTPQMAQRARMYPAKVVKVVTFSCGCICEYPIEGQFAELGDWHITPCKKHTEERLSMAQRADVVWQRFDKSVREKGEGYL